MNWNMQKAVIYKETVGLKRIRSDDLTRGPWALTLCLRTNMAIGQSSEVVHTLSLSLYPQGLKLSLFSLYGQRFLRYRPIFKIAIFGHETLLLANVPKVAHIPSFYPRGSKFSLFLLYGQRFLRYGPIFKIAIFGHETWQVSKVPEIAHISLFYPKGLKLSSFLLYWQRFLRCGTIFKIAIFGHETWQVAKVPQVTHIPSFYPTGWKLSLFFALRAAVSEIRTNFQNCYIWA